ncbi:MAG: hypothetical protein IPL60_12010 [Ardenticatenia bacterium]|nr:hypothetical protein [Ardenticatenia bacterium]
MDSRDSVTVSAAARVDAGERSEADSPAPWVVAFEARLEARERAWRRGRWWGWVGMGVGNLVVASVFSSIAGFPILLAERPIVLQATLRAETMTGTGGPWTLVDAIDAFGDASLIVLPGFVFGPAIWLSALALSYANVRVRQAIATRRQG